MGGFSTSEAFPDRSAKTPITNGNSTILSEVGSLYSICTRGGRLRLMNF